MQVLGELNGKRFELNTPIKLSEILDRSESNGAAIFTVVAAKVNGKIVDLSYELKFSDEVYQIEFVNTSMDEGLEVLRHSTSHIMTQAVKRLFGNRVQLGVGPATATGFYQDFDVEELTANDLPKIEEEMRTIIAEKNNFVRTEIPKQEALDIFKDDDLKCRLIEKIPDDVVSVYRQREYNDLCRGPHVPNSSFVNNFKLLKISGSSWEGDSKQKSLKRISGIVCPTPELLEAELHRLEEAELRDHRRLNADLDLFVFSPLAPGMPFMKPNGAIIYNQLIELKREKMRKYEYHEVRTPSIISSELWKTSGHWEHFQDNMYKLTVDEEDYAVKPMNCPGSTIVYCSSPHSYRDLPLRYGEFGFVHRKELSGTMNGLFRVRAFMQDDAHLYVRRDQIQSEVSRTINMFFEIYNIFGFKTKVALSTRPEKRMGEEVLWDIAENDLRIALESNNIEYTLKEGDGAFYGPKIDFHLEDCLGRTWQCGTCQLDFQLPEKFDISFVSADGSLQRPVIIHPAAYGSIERFMGICLEEFEGKLPTWLAPIQVAILPISDKFQVYAETITKTLRENQIRFFLDTTNETVGKKLYNARSRRYPYILIVGKNEENDQTVSVRDRLQTEQRGVSLEKFINVLQKDITERQRIPFGSADF